MEFNFITMQGTLCGNFSTTDGGGTTTYQATICVDFYGVIVKTDGVCASLNPWLHHLCKECITSVLLPPLLSTELITMPMNKLVANMFFIFKL